MAKENIETLTDKIAMLQLSIKQNERKIRHLQEFNDNSRLAVERYKKQLVVLMTEEETRELERREIEKEAAQAIEEQAAALRKFHP